MIIFGVRRAFNLPIDKKAPVEFDITKNPDIFNLLIICLLIGFVLDQTMAFIHWNHNVKILAGLIRDLIQFYCIMPILIFSLPLIVFKHLEIKNALIEGYRKLGLYWKEITVCYLCVLFIIYFDLFILHYKNMPVLIESFNFIVCILMIWLMPMYFILAGLFYRAAYGKQL
jgi:hypothetical protein